MQTLKRAANRLLFVLIFSTLLSCDKEVETLVEAPKSIAGKWQIVKASRNGLEITGAMDFSSFRIQFSQDNTYRMENYLPFIVRKEGTWSMDDPQYPFLLSFQETGQTEPLATQLNFPIVSGKRQIRLTFSPGCAANAYEYVLEKVTE